MRSVLGMWGVLAFFASSLSAQTPAQIVDNYINQANTLAFMLGQIVDAHTAQSTMLRGNILNFNQALASVKSIYGNPAASQVLAEKSAAMTAAQSKLAAEQTRLLTGNCSAEGTIKSVNGPAIKPLVANSSSQPLRFYWLDYQGQRSGGGVLQPGQESVFGTFAGHPFVFVDPAGRCVRVMSFNGSGGYERVTPLLAPSVGPTLALIQK